VIEKCDRKQGNESPKKTPNYCVAIEWRLIQEVVGDVLRRIFLI